MMIFYRELYCDDEIKNQIYKIKWKLRHRKVMFHVYVLVINPLSMRLEFFDACQMRQKQMRNHRYIIVGIANSKQQATDLAIRILADTREAVGNFAIAEYFSRDRRIQEALKIGKT